MSTHQTPGGESSLSDTEIVEWICSNASKLGIKPEFTGHKEGKLVVEYTDIRQLVTKLKSDQ